MDRPQQIQAQPIARRPAPGQVQAGAVLTPKDIVAIIRRHLWLIIILSFVGLIGGGATWYLLRKYNPKYTAVGYIRVLPPVETDPMKVSSPIVAQDIQYGRRVYITALLKEQGMLTDLLNRDRIKQTKWFNSFGSDNNLGLRIRDAFEDLKNNLNAAASRDAEFVTVSMTCSDAQESADIANEMIDLFIGSQRDSAVSGVRNKLVELEKRRTSIEHDLALAERSLADVRSATGLTDIEEHNFQDTVTIRVQRLEQQQQDLALQASQLQANIATLEKRTTQPIGEQIENIIERDPTMVMLTQQLFVTETSLAQVEAKFGENHRTVRVLKRRAEELQQKRDERKQQIGRQQLMSDLKDAQDQLVALRQQLQETERQRQQADADKKKLDLARVQYDQRLRIRDQLQAQLDGIKDLIEARRIQAEDPETPKVMKLGAAQKPLQMSSPVWYVDFPAGTMLGFTCSMGLAFLFELLNDLLRTPRDVARYVRIPLLGVVPHVSEDDELEGIDLCHVARLAPYSIISEAYRQLRVNLKLSKTPNGSKVVFVTSCGAGDGKTSVAMNLASSLVGEGSRVLLVDANFWRPTVHKAFSLQGNPQPRCDENGKSTFGLSNLLDGRAEADEVIRPSGIDRFDVIDAGATPPNPTELLACRRMQELIDRSRQYYDHIIIDGPPVLLVSGAKVLAGCADGTLLVFNADMTRRGAAQRAVRELREVDATILGCVLMGARVLKGGYFHEQYRSYQRYRQPLLAG
jgi:succinoglycan biosynthesis transport protein ExoP